MSVGFCGLVCFHVPTFSFGTSGICCLVHVYLIQIDRKMLVWVGMGQTLNSINLNVYIHHYVSNDSSLLVFFTTVISNGLDEGEICCKPWFLTSNILKYEFPRGSCRFSLKLLGRRTCFKLDCCRRRCLCILKGQT